MIALSCPQYRLGHQDVATDQALRATTTALGSMLHRDLHGVSEAESREWRLAGSRCGRGSNTVPNLTVFNRPSSRVRILAGQRGGRTITRAVTNS
jgi:hypothetical protein